MQTIKLPYTLLNLTDSSAVKNLILNQNSVVKCIYSFLVKNPNATQKDITKFYNSLNNIIVDSWLKQSAYYEAKQFIDKLKVIFGGKKLFKKRCLKKITNEEFKLKKMFPLSSIGEAIQKGNRKFQINLENNEILFKPSKDLHISLQLPQLRKNYLKQMQLLEQLSKNKLIPIQFKLDMNFIYISFDEEFLIENFNKNFKNNRICALDLNPNSIGYSIIEWNSDTEFKILKAELINFNNLEGNKKKHEIILACERIVNQASHFQCKFLALEELHIANKNHRKGKKFNKLVNNNWMRKLIQEQISKKCIHRNIELVAVPAYYSSIIGNIFFENLKMPDAILASVEISRRCFLISSKASNGKNIYPFLKDEKLKAIKESLEERNNSIKDFSSIVLKDWEDIFSAIKNPKMRYRVTETEMNSASVFKLKYYKNKVDVKVFACLDYFT